MARAAVHPPPGGEATMPEGQSCDPVILSHRVEPP